MKLVLAGGTGFIGQAIERQYSKLGYEIVHISRSRGISWTDENAIVDALEGADLVVNMAGKSVNCRYTDANKAEIFRSRLETTATLRRCILQCQSPPRVWMNSSTATIYRHAEDRPMTEATGEIGTGFSIEVAKAWEHELFQDHLPHTRRIALRIAVVLGRDGGALPPYVNLVRFGLGGIQGSGKMYFSWVHMDDVVQSIRFLEMREELSGAFNVSSPHPVQNHEFMRTLRHQLKMPVGLPATAWMIKIGTWVIGSEPELVLKSRWVLPERLQQAGYMFKHPELKPAVAEILGKK